MTTACFGELLLRLSPPGRELLMQSYRFDAHVGGAEANVAVGLACLGHSVRMISAVPDNPMGRGARDELRRHGVDTATVQISPEGRLGLYFLSPGAGLRASEVAYDRAHSVFADAPADAWDWDAALDGVTRLPCRASRRRLGPTPRTRRSRRQGRRERGTFPCRSTAITARGFGRHGTTTRGRC